MTTGATLTARLALRIASAAALLAIGLALGLAVAANVPAEAAGQKRQKAAPAKRSIVAAPPQAPFAAPHPHDVTLPSGEVVGRDPDPFIRLMIRRDPTPWLEDD